VAEFDEVEEDTSRHIIIVNNNNNYEDKSSDIIFTGGELNEHSVTVGPVFRAAH